MAKKTLKTRQQQKRGTSTDWGNAKNFTPLDGEIIIYSDLNTFKIGDGKTLVNDLPFAEGAYTLNLENGTGAGSAQMKQDGTSGTFSFTGKNPNATALDSSLTGEIAYGAVGAYSTAFGGKSSAQGKRSFACGTATISTGDYSFAGGDSSVALGGNSFAVGLQTTAVGNNSFSAGNNTVANGENSTVFGVDLESGYDAQTIVGKHNSNKSYTLFEVGNGSSSSDRRNAFEVLSDGRAKVQAAPTESTDVVRLEDLSTISTTYSNLVSLRGSGKLIPGATYRITDYACATTTADTQSANHPFDILVTADSANTLNENAHAIMRANDTYFAKSKLQSWELKYCLDNDSNRFAWASSSDKGVIYYMKDEFGNECPYDFKNIQFKRYKVTNSEAQLSSLSGRYLGYSSSGASAGLTVDSSSYIWCFTFSRMSAMTGSVTVTDASLNTSSTSGSMCHHNTMGAYGSSVMVDETYSTYKQSLNNNVFETTSRAYANHLGENCYGNTFGNACYGNTFGNACYGNTFGNTCYDNAFGDSCYDNAFGNNCYDNAFGNNCARNAFGDSCPRNAFGNGCSRNAFGNNCSDNAFGNTCYNNAFGDSCARNAFGNGCARNAFGNGCARNAFGNNCARNELCSNTDYARYNAFENGVEYVTLDSPLAGTSSTYLQNVHIHEGVMGTSSAAKTITVDRNLSYGTDVYAEGHVTMTV